MKIVFRTDASTQIGTGHLSRCLTLADEMKKRGADVLFFCRKHPGFSPEFIQNRGHRVVALPKPDTTQTENDGLKHSMWLGVSQLQDARETSEELLTNGFSEDKKADWLIVDHYSLDARWESQLQDLSSKIMCIDDLADRFHKCHILLDQNLHTDMKKRYNGKLPANCQKLLGPKYALLRPDFLQLRNKLKNHDGNVNRILVFMGGSDPTNETKKVLEALSRIKKQAISVDVVVGAVNPFRQEIAAQCTLLPNVSFFCQVGNIAELMLSADLSIGGAGSATWERCSMGLPSILISIADNQDDLAESVQRVNAAIFLGKKQYISIDQLASSIQKTINNKLLLQQLSKNSASLVDGHGTERVLRELGI